MSALPGDFPYTRGIGAEMYRDDAWAMVQQAGAGLPEDGNRRLLDAIANGATMLAVWPDRPGAKGWDADDPQSAASVGLGGISLNHAGDFQQLLTGVDPSIPLFLRARETAAPLLAFHLVAARQAGLHPARLRGVIGNDVLCSRLSSAGIFPARASMRLAGEVSVWIARELPGWTVLTIDGSAVRAAGASPALEIAISVAAFLEYVVPAAARGIAVEDLAPRTQFALSAGMRFLEEAAKFRAARRLFATVLKYRLGVEAARAMALRIHADTVVQSLATEQTDVNVIRASVQTLAALLGGVQSLYTGSREEAIAPPQDDSARLALRTQQIARHESGVALTADPAGGSYFLEQETDRIEADAREELRAIEAEGGLVGSLESGQLAARLHHEIQPAIVGVTQFVMTESTALEAPAADPAKEKTQTERLRDWRASRSEAECQAALIEVERAALGADPLMPPILAAAAHATLGEITARLRAVLI